MLERERAQDQADGHVEAFLGYVIEQARADGRTEDGAGGKHETRQEVARDGKAAQAEERDLARVLKDLARSERRDGALGSELERQNERPEQRSGRADLRRKESDERAEASFASRALRKPTSSSSGALVHLRLARLPRLDDQPRPSISRSSRSWCKPTVVRVMRPRHRREKVERFESR